MRASHYYFGTTKNTFAQAELISHQLMLKAGFIRSLSAGLYTWLPTGLRVLRKVEAIVREEMVRIGCCEVFMPCIQPADLWQESGRWTLFGPQMLTMQDRHGRDFCFGPTHEEVITDLIRREVTSYKQLPLSFFQIQTKFRDELRPRFGVMRAREFLMKDAYSFHLDESCLSQRYQDFYGAYVRIFTRLGLTFKIVQADNGAIGGAVSHEFHVLSDAGEDVLLYHEETDFAVNQELAPLPLSQPAWTLDGALRGERAIASSPADMTAVRLWFCDIAELGSVAVALCAHHDMSVVKLSRFVSGRPVVVLSDDIIQTRWGARLDLCTLPQDVVLWADASAAALPVFVMPSRDTQGQAVLSWSHPVPIPAEVGDFRLAVAGDVSPAGFRYQMCRGIEVGHVFQLGTKYSEQMSCVVQRAAGMQPLFMGCYGVGVSRIVAAAIEQSHDDRGMIWPDAMAPFQCAIVVMYTPDEEAVLSAAVDLYEALCRAGIDVLLDDRLERPGARFADIDLIGIPHRLVINRRLLAQGQVEYKHRTEEAVSVHEIAHWPDWLMARLS